MGDTIIALVALGLSLVSAVASGVTYFCGIRRQRRTATLDAYNRLQNEALDPLYIGYTKKKIEELAANGRCEQYRSEYKTVGTYVARIEHFCVGVVEKIYDRDTVYELADGFFNGTVRDLISPIIDRKDSCFQGEYYENTRKVFELLDEKNKGR